MGIKTDFQGFCAIMDRLLSENGCPWDKAQTHGSLRRFLIEECYEAVDAIDNNDMAGLCEELGDVLLEVVFHAKIAEKQGGFGVDDVVDGISRKMVSRHKHIFGGASAASPEEVLAVWERAKDEEKGFPSAAEKMRAVPKAMPALMRAAKVLKRSGAEAPITKDEAGYIQSLLDATIKKSAEAPENGQGAPGGGIEGQLGELLFFVARLCGFFGANPELALTNAVETYITRFVNGENPVN